MVGCMFFFLLILLPGSLKICCHAKHPQLSRTHAHTQPEPGSLLATRVQQRSHLSPTTIEIYKELQRDYDFITLIHLMSTAIGRSLRTKMGASSCVCLCVHLMMSEDRNYLSSLRALCSFRSSQTSQIDTD